MRILVRPPFLHRSLVAVVALAVLAPATAAHAAADPLQAAVDRVTAATKAQNDATARYDAAQTAYYRLQDEMTSTQKNINSLADQQRDLATLARMRALVAYKGGAPLFDGLFDSTDDLMQAARRATMLDRVNAKGNDAIARLADVTDDLHAKQGALRGQVAHAKTALDAMKAEEHATETALADASAAEKSLRAQLAAEQRAREYAALVAAARAKARPAVVAAGNPGGGRSGGDGPGRIIGSGSWVCPVQGPVSFHDDWGEPRGGGSRGHKGNDMFAPGGTPVVSPVAGRVWFQSDSLGGLAFYVDAPGVTYYGAHLSDYVGGDRAVKAGELIGHVGNTGDAAGGPTHLHFEIRMGGANGTRIDPYPTISAHC